jgi:hypothetical protein
MPNPLDYRLYHAVNEFSTDFKWLAHATYFFETVGVVFYGLAVVLLWLATRPGEERRWKIAALAEPRQQVCRCSSIR